MPQPKIETFMFHPVDRHPKLKDADLRYAICDGRLFVNPALGGMAERVAMLACMCDGQPMVQCGKHVLVDMEWLKRERPKLAAELDRVTDIMIEAAKNAA